MRKLLLTFALVLGGAAFAQSPKTEELKREEKQAWEGVKHGAKKATNAAKELVAPDAAPATEAQGTFRAEKAFPLSGTLQQASAERITLARPGLPPASLDVREKTKVTLDGRRISADQLPEGVSVRAKFQLEGRETVAVSIDAHSTK